MTRATGTSRPLIALLVALAGTACGRGDGLAYGDANDVIVGARPELWEQVQDTIRAALEPTILTVRDERTFEVTYHDPSEATWANLRRFGQLLLIGTPDEPWLAEVLGRHEGPVPEPPALLRVRGPWARNQEVTVILVPPGEPVAAVADVLDELHAHYDEQYREWALARMFVTGADSALTDSLRSEAGFALLVPEVYRWSREGDTYVFRNDQPDPSELLRQVTVTWRSPIPPGMQPEDLLAWRSEIAAQHYGAPQDVDLSLTEAGPFQYRGHDAYQIQAIWTNADSTYFPTAGPFITRAVICREQDRMYLLDAWLYAPGRDKYEYMIQLHTILDSFRCDG